MVSIAYTFPDLLRWVFVVLSGLFVGGALRMLGRFWRHHGVSSFLLGSTLLVVASDGYALARIGDPLVWYTPVALAGVLLLIVALVLLASFGPDEPVTLRAALDRRRAPHERKGSP